ncbi:MAG: prolipoprotein diacylglyceryl transferase family protein [Ferruginibacter sp.]
MYPNLYYIFKDWFGVEWHALGFLNSFGLMVAISFIAAAIVLTSELRRKEKQGLLQPREETITVGKPASTAELVINFITGFIFGYKLFGLFLSKPELVTAQEYIFSREGNFLGGLLLGAILLGIKWYEKNKIKLKNPEQRTVRIWPHDRVGDIVILALVFGILGAKLFDNLENWNEFIQDPIGRIFSASGLTFYGGLILAAIAICWYAYRKGIKLVHLVDSAAPALMIAYAIGRIGCQVSGDGDWGIYNSAYTSDAYGNVSAAAPADFENTLKNNATYFTEGKVLDSAGKSIYVTDRAYGTLDSVPHKSFRGAGFLPNWFFAYSFPQNVNKDGVLIPGVTDEHNRVLPSPVFPTSLYEFLICTLLFALLWFLRKSIHVPLVMFGLYLVLNGLERFFMELMRVNKLYNVAGIRLSQAEIIALCLILVGIGTIIYAYIRYKKSPTEDLS